MIWLDITAVIVLGLGPAVLFSVAANYRGTRVAGAMDWFLVNVRRMKHASEDELIRAHVFWFWFQVSATLLVLVAGWLAGFPAVRGGR